MSDVSSFQLNAKSLRADVSLKSSSEQNLYKRTITITNSGGALTNYQVNFQLDTKELYRLNKTSYTCSDIRIYDTDGTTLLSHWVENPYASKTSIWVKVPSIGASTTKAIYLEYGNVELPNTSSIDDTFDNVFSKTGQKWWFKANDMHKDFRFDDFDNQTAPEWNNQHNPEEYLATDSYLSDNAPQYNLNEINNQPALTFDDANSEALRGYNPFQYDKVAKLTAGLDYEIYIVEARDSNKTNNFLLVQDNSSATTNGKLNIGYTSNTNFRLGQISNDLNYTVAGYTSPIWRTWTCILDQFNQGGLGGAGHYIRLNGATVASNTNTAPLINTNDFWVGFDNSTNYYSGKIAEILCLPILTSSERTLVNRYFAGKYRNYGSEPTTSVGSESNITQTTTWVSYLPFVNSWSVNSSLEPIKLETVEDTDVDQSFFGIVSTRTEVEIINMFRLIFAFGNGAETWSNSTLNSESVLTAQCSRTTTATTSANIDTITIERDEGGVNRNDLSKYPIDNDIVTTTYSSTDDDYIIGDFYFEDHGLISLTNSYIRFENTAGSLSYQSNLTNNINVLASNELVSIKIKKSDFTKVGAGDWSDITKMKVNIQTSSSSQTVYYNNFRLEIDKTRLFQIGDQIKLGVYVSDDEFSTSYLANVEQGVINKIATTDNGWKFEIINPLDKIISQKWSDFSSFPYYNWVYENIQPNNNLLVNNSDQYDINNWTLGVNVTENGEIADQNGEYKSYAYSYTQTSTSSDIVSEFIPVSASTQYTFSAYMKRQGTIGTANIKIQWFNSSFVSISTSTSSSLGITESWVRYSYNPTSPVSTAYAKITLPSNVNGTIDFSTPQFEAGGTAGELELYNEQGLTEFAKKLLNFTIKNSLVDVNLGEFGKPQNLQKNIFPKYGLIFQKEAVKDSLEKLLTSTMGIASYNPDNGIVIRSGDQIWSSNLDTIEITDNQIINYQVIFDSVDIINSITVIPSLSVEGNKRLQVFVSTNGQNSRIEPTEDQAYRFGSSDYKPTNGLQKVRPYGQNLRLGVNFTSDPQNPTYNNISMILLDKRLKDESLYIRFQNNDSVDKYVWHLESSTWSITYFDSLDQNRDNYKDLPNFYAVPPTDITVQGNAISGVATTPGDITRWGYDNSIATIGRKNITIHNDLVDYATNSYSEAVLPILRGINQTPQKYSLDLIYRPDIQIGKQIKFVDPDNNNVQAVVTSLSVDFTVGSSPTINIICQRVA